ncbi:hypothetical protein OAB57_03325 [Bacteriovoracaceae bacterium]|nr:hypothetical protein [Bacteriovoracaceae bacterium]
MKRLIYCFFLISKSLMAEIPHEMLSSCEEKIYQNSEENEQANDRYGNSRDMCIAVITGLVSDGGFDCSLVETIRNKKHSLKLCQFLQEKRSYFNSSSKKSNRFTLNDECAFGDKVLPYTSYLKENLCVALIGIVRGYEDQFIGREKTARNKTGHLIPYGQMVNDVVYPFEIQDLILEGFKINRSEDIPFRRLEVSPIKSGILKAFKIIGEQGLKEIFTEKVDSRYVTERIENSRYDIHELLHLRETAGTKAKKYISRHIGIFWKKPRVSGIDEEMRISCQP